MAQLHPEWLQTPIPQEVLSSQDWLESIHFFLIESPCPGQSYRQNKYIEKWGATPWNSERCLKAPLNKTIFGTKKCDKLRSAKNKQSLNDILESLRLGSDFPEDADIQRAAFVTSSKKGDTSLYMSFFYHLRNSLAHARIGFIRNSKGEFTILFEDGKPLEKATKFEPTARGIINLKSLSLAVRLIKKGPEAQPDIEEQILSAIKSGVDTKKKIKEALKIADSDWRTYSQTLKMEGKLTQTINTDGFAVPHRPTVKSPSTVLIFCPTRN